MVQEIRRQMKRNGPELREQHRRCPKNAEEDNRRVVQRAKLRQDVTSIPGPKVYTLLALENESLDRAITLAGVKPSPEDTVIVLTKAGSGGIDRSKRLVTIDLDRT